MKSFCIKTNDEEKINYLQTEFNKIQLKNIKVRKSKFKIYKNIIIHYNGKEEKKFLLEISSVLANCIEKFYEYNLLKNYL